MAGNLPSPSRSHLNRIGAKMAPSPHPDSLSSSIEYTPEYNAFIEKLAEYHEKRGTEFIREPRVGSRSIDLFKLYTMVMERGGYDKVSDEKLAWRKLGQDFNLGTLNLPALAFSLKTVYYKNLAAYEISTVHGKEPPPKEILEYQTAKGGALLTRTMENYKPRKDMNDHSEASGDDGTPARGERNGSEETPGSGGRVTRGLRQAPPQSSLFYQVDWQISYTEDGTMFSSNVLDGAEGTPNILERIARLTKLDVDDNIQPAEFSDALLQVIEAALTMRNMVMLEENAQYVSEMAPLRDFLSIALNLPNLESVIELKHYALDIAEQLTRYLHFEENDPLYISLLAQLQSQDRGAILTSLRAIGRISMDLEENNLLRGVPKAAVQNIMDWTILNDEEMVHACLDFLYQYTAVVDNVDFLTTNVQVEPLVNQLTRLLTHGAKDVVKEIGRVPDGREPAPDDLARLPRELLTQLLRLEEPDRSSQWLRCLFEEDPQQAITQIKLWAAYQECFIPTVQETGRSILPAADFIKNQTAADEQHQAAGIPLSAVLVLRNLARNLSKTDAEQNVVKLGGVSFVDKLFKPVEPRLYEVMAHNKALTMYMTDLLSSVNAS
ncbi:putative Chromatin structure-remodeling complex subunit rsc9 [Glarea lozoyensis 74030]|uniref:Putative Chromatin structure-remodeling complex subunit rsc9 n=1 Tax=Glarea lozoyensis (strain ATCC 74030 / MF5533) TaxID=1104152 RepID=H0ER91_GLAL7|nr:putative Chromatin structure-remodeling complex subunit rsc9 [Glarea lozoyensis 74030]